MRHSLFCLIPLVLLTACATPRERCVSQAREPLAELDRRIAVARGNIARGYAVAEVRDTRFVTQTCSGLRNNGDRFYYPCTKPVRVTREEPVAIDVTDERRKLAEFGSARISLARQAGSAVNQCASLYPE
ncbi:hypothetical protein LX81_00089 [Palleronia aestuarii]|uniref:Uncharacterized protein n=1 Tax=Palleronia aestuarii TaxID=568105 RepID=A0A2W7P8A4_9RHOB|nr:hypothetical protein [Palleronia aestuarii]PZX19632.1 hypothetical protein LX81_00089 [Palleronia aestuarii]